MTEIREVPGGRRYQGVDEAIAYKVTTTVWGSAPAGLVVSAYDITDGKRLDVTATVLTGAASAAGDVVTLPKLGALTAKHLYRLELTFTSGVYTYECYFLVEAEV